MQRMMTLTRRELAAFFVSFTGYVVIASVLLLVGLSFWNLLEALRGEAAPAPMTELFFNTTYFWIVVLLSAPMITMRLFALEKFSGTFETLMTTPVSDLQVVLAKFIAALAFFMVTWLPLLGYMLLLQPHVAAGAQMDWGTTGSTFLGIFLLGSLFMAAGSFASALTRSQIIAAVLALGMGVSLLLLSYLSKSSETIRTPWLADAVVYMSLFNHMEDFSRGIIDSRAVAFYVTATAFFLFLTYCVVQSRRWK